MHLQGMWHQFMGEAGNAPGVNKGDVVITLMQPIGGISELTVPSNDVSVAAEAGNLIGLQVMLPDGRRLFVNSGNLAGFVDAPADQDAPARRGKGKAAEGKNAGDPGSPPAE